MGVAFASVTILLALFISGPTHAQFFAEKNPPEITRLQQHLNALAARDYRQNPGHSPISLLLSSDYRMASESAAGLQVRRMATHMGPVAQYRISSKLHLFESLRSVPGEIIRSVVVIGFHGSNGGNHPALDFTGQNSTTYLVELENMAPFISPRFSPNATIVFRSCELVPGPHNLDGAMQSFRAIARGLTMKSGWIYANHTAGNDLIDQNLGTPTAWIEKLFGLPSGPDSQIGDEDRWNSQVFFFLALPYYLYLQKKVDNQGYWYGFSRENNTEVLVQARYWDARWGKIQGRVLRAMGPM